MIGFSSPVLSSNARRAASGTRAQGAALYARQRILHRLLRGFPTDFPEMEPDRTRLIVRRLAAALRAERALGRAGHWTYDINRHIALRQAYLAESLALRRAAAAARSGAARQSKGAPG